MKITSKRIYEGYAKDDGFRVLVDRLWPRGISKARAKLHFWDKDIAPSAALRLWFHKDPEKRSQGFSKRYRKELSHGGEISRLREKIKGKKMVTLVTAVKEIKHSHVPILLRELKKI